LTGYGGIVRLKKSSRNQSHLFTEQLEKAAAGHEGFEPPDCGDDEDWSAKRFRRASFIKHCWGQRAGAKLKIP
jgi:hypothetical protein